MSQYIVLFWYGTLIPKTGEFSLTMKILCATIRLVVLSVALGFNPESITIGVGLPQEGVTAQCKNIRHIQT